MKKIILKYNFLYHLLRGGVLIFLRIIRHKKLCQDQKKYKQLNKRPEFNIRRGNKWLFFTDWDNKAGGMTTYFYQDLWAAKKIFEANPNEHLDIGSRIDGFILALLSFREVTLIDIRPLEHNIDGLNFIQEDATMLSGIQNSSIQSISALCSLEHFGLGRYGDSIDPEACFKSFKAIQRVLLTGGRLYLSVPVSGKDRLEFNAHRIFAPETIIREFSEMRLREFVVVAKDGKIVRNPMKNRAWDLDKTYTNFGLFEFEKL